MLKSPVLPEIEALDPIRDHQRIVFLSTRIDFPWDTTRALEFALFHTFAVPSISALLHKTREFEERAQKRYDDTDIIVSNIMEHGYDSELGKAAIGRMNALHSRFKISNEDFLYVLSTFVFEPIRWNERFGWRRMIETERLALFHFWREVGHRMSIRDIPTGYHDFENFNRHTEQMKYRFTESNQLVGAATRALFMSWFPRWMGPLVKRGIHGFMDENLIVAFGFPKPSKLMRRTVALSLKLRGNFLRQLWLRRREPVWRTKMTHQSYPEGYTMESLGPPPT
jgi:hypothetical protein